MSKIDTSDIYEVGTYFGVNYKGKCFEYFTSRAGAEEYLEVLRNGENKEAGTMSKVQRVLQDNSSKGGDKSRERKDSGFLYDSGL